MIFHCSATLTEKVLPDVQIEPPLLHFVLTVSCIGMRHHWFCPLCTLLQVFIHVGKISLSLLFSRLNSLRSLSFSPVEEVLQSLYHLCALIWTLSSIYMSLLYWRGLQVRHLGRIISLILLALLLLIQPRLSLTLNSKETLLLVNLVSVWAPRTFPTKQLSIWVPLAMCWCVGLFFSRWNCALPLLDLHEVPANSFILTCSDPSGKQHDPLACQPFLPVFVICRLASETLHPINGRSLMKIAYVTNMKL